jgi:hypothetical protein
MAENTESTLVSDSRIGNSSSAERVLKSSDLGHPLLRRIYCAGWLRRERAYEPFKKARSSRFTAAEALVMLFRLLTSFGRWP